MERAATSNNDQMSGLDGQGHPEPMTAEGAANTLKFIADDHPCCAHALGEIVAWLEFNHHETTVAREEIAKLKAERDGIFRELELTKMQVEIFRLLLSRVESVIGHWRETDWFASDDIARNEIVVGVDQQAARALLKKLEAASKS